MAPPKQQSNPLCQEMAKIEGYHKQQGGREKKDALPFLKMLVEAEVDGKFNDDSEQAEQAAVLDFYNRKVAINDDSYEEYEEVRVRAKKLRESVNRRVLDPYYDNLDEKPSTRIVLPKQGDRYRPTLFAGMTSVRDSMKSTSPEGSPIAAFQRTLHRYHLTLDRAGNPVWLYTVLNNLRMSRTGVLTTFAPILLDRRESASDHEYSFELSMLGNHLLVRLQRSDRTHDAGVELFPHPVTSRNTFFGARITDTWYGVPPKVVMSMVILSYSPLDGLDAETPGPIDCKLSGRLRDMWERNAAFEHLISGHGTPEHPSRVSVAAKPKGTAANILPRNEADLVHLGTNKQAIRFLIERVSTATLVEDTAVRWESRNSLWSGDSMKAFTAAVAQNKNLEEFRSVVGPIVDIAYAHALQNAAQSTMADTKFSCYRLKHTAPLMNFMVVYSGEEPARQKAVFFGYGRQMSPDGDDDTAVFFSENPALVKEFRRLFRILRDERYSQAIDVANPDLLQPRDYRTDILATFVEWPSEIGQRIRGCSGWVRICATAWPMLDRLIPNIEHALSRQRPVSIALWRSASPILGLRSDAITRPGYVEGSVRSNIVSLEGLERQSVNKGFQLQLFECDGWPSASIFWIDDLIYFSGYWVGVNASDGPHFLVHESSPTGQFLIGQYEAMLKRGRPITFVDPPPSPLRRVTRRRSS